MEFQIVRTSNFIKRHTIRYGWLGIKEYDHAVSSKHSHRRRNCSEASKALLF